MILHSSILSYQLNYLDIIISQPNYLDMRLEDARLWGHEGHVEDSVGEAVEEGKVSAVLVPPKVDVAVNRQPGSRYLHFNDIQ